MNTGTATLRSHTDRALDRLVDRLDGNVENIERRLERALDALNTDLAVMAVAAFNVTMSARRLMTDPQRLSSKLGRRRKLTVALTAATVAATLYRRSGAVEGAGAEAAKTTHLTPIVTAAVTGLAATKVVETVVKDRVKLPATEAVALSVMLAAPSTARHLEQAKQYRKAKTEG